MNPAEVDEDAKRRFESIYRATRVPILGYLLRRVTAPVDAPDLLGEVYAIAWRRIAEVPDGEEARLWLYGVARRVLANHYRREQRESQLGDRLREQLAMELDLLGHGRSAPPSRLTECLAALPPADRELLQLNAWEGLSAAEIARVADLTPGAVRVRLHRIRKRLAAQMHGAGEPADPPLLLARSELDRPELSIGT